MIGDDLTGLVEGSQKLLLKASGPDSAQQAD